MNVCRLCLSKSPDKDIFQLKTSKKYGDKRYQDILLFCLDIEVTEEVEITKKMCTKCFKKVLTFYKFKCMVLENDVYLKSSVPKVSVKLEPIDEDEVYSSQVSLDNTLEGVQNTLKNEYDFDEIQYNFKAESPYDDQDHSQGYKTNSEFDKNEITLEILKDDVEKLEPSDDKLENIPSLITRPNISKKLIKIKPLYPCKECDKVFKSPRGRLKHNKTIHLNMKSQCQICNKDVVDLKQHILNMHEKDKMKQQCEECNRRFTHKSKMRNHLCKPDGVTKILKCCRCNVKFTDNGEYINHIRTEHEEEKRYWCAHCGDGFFYKGHLARHIQKQHLGKESYLANKTNAEPKRKVRLIKKYAKFTHKYDANLKGYPCEICNKVLHSRQGIRKHLNMHMGVKQQCDMCEKKVVDLKQHMSLIHGDPSGLKLKCELCHRRFDRLHRLRDHLCENVGEMSYNHHCSHCEKKFRTQSNLTTHIRRVHKRERNYMCHFCSKGFFTKCRLIRHIRSHTKEKPFKCLVCENNFSDDRALRNHMFIHENKADFQCHICYKRFVAPGYLRNHMVVHNKEKKHPCKYCGVRFVRSDHRKRHEYTAHEKAMSLPNLNE